MSARSAVTRFLRFATLVFFRRVEVDGLEHIPRDGPVIFAVNHPNGLVDPLFLLCFAPRPVSFLAKAPLFGYPVIGWFARAFDSIPVYRKQDNTSGTNAETFGRAREVLARGGAIAIFPEGTTHSDAQLRELKTGAARIALGASLASMTVIPTGIYYTAKQTFRSSALVCFGPPIAVTSAAVDERGEPPAGPVAELTAQIDRGLDEVTLQADSLQALDLIAHAEDIFTATDEQPLAEELELRRRFVEGYSYLRERDPSRLARLSSAITRFGAELARARLEPHELKPRFDVGAIVRVVFLLPLAFIGLVLHYPTYRLVGLLARRFAKGESEMTATMKFLAALLFFPLTWLAFATLAAWRVGAVYAFVALLLFPLLAYIALRVFEDLDDLVGRLRALARGRTLAEQRRAILAEIGRVGEEMGFQ